MSFFRAVVSATQSISSLVETELVFGSEIADPDSAFASNHFTVPAGWNGKVGCLTAGYYSTSPESTLLVRIQKQTAGAGPWVTISEAGCAKIGRGGVSAFPVQFATGDKYRVTYYGTSTTKGNDLGNHFSGWCLPSTISKLGMFRAGRTSNQSMAANGFRVATFQTEEIDSHSFLDAATGIVTVPSAFNGGFLHLTAGFRSTVSDTAIYIERSTDGGSTWSYVARGAAGGICARADSGAVPAVTGDKFRLSGFTSGANFSFVSDPRSFFAGMFVA